LKPRVLSLAGDCHLQLEPDPDHPERYLVRFCGLNRDRAAYVATQSARVKLMMAHRQGRCPDPYPLPARVTIGWLDRHGWHLGRSAYAAPLADMPAVRDCLDQLLDDLVLRVTLVAAAAEGGSRSGGG
jgi:hypothetical protein